MTTQPTATVITTELRMSGSNARTIIINCHAIMRNKFRGSLLWVLVSHITGHGSGYSVEICKSANLDPFQTCGVNHLRPHLDTCDLCGDEFGQSDLTMEGRQMLCPKHKTQ